MKINTVVIRKLLNYGKQRTEIIVRLIHPKVYSCTKQRWYKRTEQVCNVLLL